MRVESELSCLYIGRINAMHNAIVFDIKDLVCYVYVRACVREVKCMRECVCVSLSGIQMF